MKDFHAQMAVTVGEQVKGKMEISPFPLYNPLYGEQILRPELLRDSS